MLDYDTYVCTPSNILLKNSRRSSSFFKKYAEDLFSENTAIIYQILQVSNCDRIFTLLNDILRWFKLQNETKALRFPKKLKIFRFILYVCICLPSPCPHSQCEGVGIGCPYKCLLFQSLLTATLTSLLQCPT